MQLVEGRTVESHQERIASDWQKGIWDRLASTYQRELDVRLAPVVSTVIRHAELQPGERVLDLGTGTGSVAVQAARAVGSTGEVLGIDISTEMLALSGLRGSSLGIANLVFAEGRAEAIPAEDAAFDVVLASLCLMFVLDRAEAAHEIARVLRPGGRLVAAVWAGPDQCDLTRFQLAAASVAPPPPVPGVGPAALADPSPFIAQLAQTGISATYESEAMEFSFDSLDHAWDVVAGPSIALLPPERQQLAKDVVRAALWPHGDGPRVFRNKVHYIVGRRRD